MKTSWPFTRRILPTVVTTNSSGDFSGLGAPVPVGKIKTVVNRLDPRRFDSIHLDAMLADLFRDSKDLVRNAGHQPIGDVVFAPSRIPMSLRLQISFASDIVFVTNPAQRSELSKNVWTI